MVDEKVDITNGDIKIMENLTWLMDIKIIIAVCDSSLAKFF